MGIRFTNTITNTSLIFDELKLPVLETKTPVEPAPTLPKIIPTKPGPREPSQIPWKRPTPSTQPKVSPTDPNRKFPVCRS